MHYNTTAISLKYSHNITKHSSNNTLLSYLAFFTFFYFFYFSSINNNTSTTCTPIYYSKIFTFYKTSKSTTIYTSVDVKLKINNIQITNRTTLIRSQRLSTIAITFSCRFSKKSSNSHNIHSINTVLQR